METNHITSIAFNEVDLSLLEESPAPPPHKIPNTVDRSKINPDVIETSTINFLLSQNEDLVARIKVLIRLVSQFENENIRFKRQANVLQTKTQVYEEKESIYKNHIKDLEQKYHRLREERGYYQEIEKENTLLNRFMSRYEKYIRLAYKKNQQKIKYELQIKKNLEDENNRLTAMIRTLETEYAQVANKMAQQSQNQQKHQNDLIQIFETQRTQLLNQIQLLKEENDNLLHKAHRLDLTTEKNTELENENIGLNRALQDSKSENVKLQLETADQKSTLQRLKEHCSHIETENQELKEQLESLRFQWSQKSEESGKLKMALNSLEKLNVDLSKKINELRVEQKS